MERQRSAAGGWVCRYINVNIWNTPTDAGEGVGRMAKEKNDLVKKKAVWNGRRSEWRRPRGIAKNRENQGAGDRSPKSVHRMSRQQKRCKEDKGTRDMVHPIGTQAPHPPRL